MNPTTGGINASQNQPASEPIRPSPDNEQGVWRPPRGGMPRTLISEVMRTCVAQGGVAEEVFEGLKGFANPK